MRLPIEKRRLAQDGASGAQKNNRLTHIARSPAMVKIMHAELYAVEIKRIRVAELNKEPSMNCTTESFMSLNIKSEIPRKLNVERRFKISG